MIVESLKSQLLAAVLPHLQSLVNGLIFIGVGLCAVTCILFVTSITRRFLFDVARNWWEGDDDSFVNTFHSYRDRFRFERDAHSGASLPIEVTWTGPRDEEGSLGGYDWHGQMSIVPGDNVDFDDDGRH
jgi:hypothetical protein